MVLVYTEIEIASPPAHVREVFLDFAKIPEWTQSHFKSIEATSQKGNTIEKGDTLKVVMEGVTFSPVVLENSDRAFKWRGSLWPIFCGDHSFRFEPSKTTEGSTTFVDEEEFSGILAFTMRLPWLGAKTPVGFENFNKDLKSRVESRT